MIVRVFEEKTGDPVHDNRARRANRALHRAPRGWKRKRAIVAAEYPRYARLVAHVARARSVKPT